MRYGIQLRLIVLFSMVLMPFPPAVWAQSSIDETSRLYREKIQPLFAEKCAACHGVLRQEAGLRLDHGSFVRAGGDSGALFGEDAWEDSELYFRLTADADLRMPPEGEGEALDDEQLRWLREWTESGAHSPADEAYPTEVDSHWAWQNPVRATLPEVENPEWQANPIDRFLYRELMKSGIQPLGKADAHTLIRRLYFDVVGLPPTPAQVREYTQMPTAEHWRTLVDQLLASRAYGERWGRHWMDVWRYSDWDGYKEQVRGSQRHIWRWRDWIINSLNEDKSYAQMIAEMLAGDELDPQDPAVLAATGFLARNYHNSNRNIWLDATVEHTSKAFLGITINCARCHDHKYDPISQDDYYAFRAVFEPHHVRTERVPGQANVKLDGLVRAFDKEPDAKTFLFVGGNEKLFDEQKPVAPGTPGVIDLTYEVDPIDLPVRAVFPAMQEFVEQEDLAAAQARLKAAEKKLAKRIEAEATEASRQNAAEETAAPSAKAEAKGAEDPATLQELEQAVLVRRLELQSLQLRWQADRLRFGESAADNQESTESSSLASLRAAIAEKRAAQEAARLDTIKAQRELTDWNGSEPATTDAEAAEPAAAEMVKWKARQKELVDALAAAQSTLEERIEQFSETLAKEPGDIEYASVGARFPSQSTGRRLALARWIASRQNPLTARVAVNYVWMHHFGEPLVDSVFDFGMRAPEPLHLALLDWLAVEFMEHDWSFKHLHRLILNSRAYQTASFAPEQELTRQVAIDPDNRLWWRAHTQRLEAEVTRDSLLAVSGTLDDTVGGPEIDFQQGQEIPRKSLYFRTAYEKQMKMLVIFDAAAPNECYRRSESIIPQQALALVNSPLSYDAARQLARNLWDQQLYDAEHDEQAIASAFETLFARPCDDEELQACMTFLGQQQELLSRDTELSAMTGKSLGQLKPADDPKLRAREGLVHALLNHNDFVTIR